MPNSGNARDQRLRKTKASLIDEIDVLEKRVALIEMATQDNFFDLDLATDQMTFPVDGRARLGLVNWDNTGKAWIERVHTDDLEAHRAMFAAALRGEKAEYLSELRLMDDDGHWRWVHMRGVFQRDADGKAFRYIGSAADVTRRKQA